jgi:hypothetical protein
MTISTGEEKRPVFTRKRLFLLIVIILGILFDYLFWGQSLGINFTVYSIICLTAGLSFLAYEGFRPAASSFLLLPLVVLFAAILPLRVEPVTTFLLFTMTIFFAGVFAATFMEGRWVRFNLVDFVLELIELSFGAFSNVPCYLLEHRERRAPGTSGKRLGYVWRVIRGFLIAAPIFLLFAGLLASADVIFSNRIEDFLSAIAIEKAPEYLLRGVIILLIAYLMAGIFIHAAGRGQSRGALMQAKRPKLSPFLGGTEWIIILGSIDLLFMAFVATQFQYFFGGDANICINGLTYAQYARRGFGELVAVATFTMLLLLAVDRYGLRESKSQKLTYSVLSGMMVSSVVVILVSAFQRLSLYEDAFGFSRLRTYTHIFIIWLGFLLVAFLVLVLVRKQRSIIQFALIASIGFVLSISFLDVDAFIVKQNVQRASDGAELDINYLQSLSDDAIPAMADAYSSSELSEQTRDELGAAITCMADERKSGKQHSWKSFNLSRRRADRSLELLEEDLNGYTLGAEEGTRIVESPVGKVYHCEKDSPTSHRENTDEDT